MGMDEAVRGFGSIVNRLEGVLSDANGRLAARIRELGDIAKRSGQSQDDHTEALRQHTAQLQATEGILATHAAAMINLMGLLEQHTTALRVHSDTSPQLSHMLGRHEEAMRALAHQMQYGGGRY